MEFPYKELERGEVTEEFAASSARLKGGPRGWEPLLYVCFSREPGDKVNAARTLLRHGADPNAWYQPEEWPDNPLSCLYGAVGLNNDPALGLVLLEAGANPNDNESLYHSTEHADLKCMRMLLAHGATPHRTNALKHMLDREDPVGLRLLLDAGADPNEVNERGDTALHWAVANRRTVETITALLDAGAAIDARRSDGRTAYALAVVSGQPETAALLEARGAQTDVPAIDHSPESARLIPDMAAHHGTASIRELLDAGLPVDARGGMGETALHWACWKGYADLAKLLLEHGASLTVEDAQYHATPVGWLTHGMKNCPEAGGDYAGGRGCCWGRER
jgi:ankyrin repeat protein